MAFKLGREKRGFKGPIIRKNLAKGILGEANNDGSIFIHKDIKPGSKQEQTVINHEAKHAEDMKAGVLGYGDDWVRYKNKTYHRKGFFTHQPIFLYRVRYQCPIFSIISCFSSTL